MVWWVNVGGNKHRLSNENFETDNQSIQKVNNKQS